MSLLFWYAAVPLQALLLYLLIRGRAYKVCPFFFSYSAFSVLAGVARFLTRNHAQTYKVTYWSTEAVYCILGIAAMYEVFRPVLRTRSRWMHFAFPGIVALAVGLSLTHAHAVPPRLHGYLVYIVTGEITVRFVQVFVFLAVGALALFCGFRWYHLGIASGFGFYCSIELLSMIVFSDLGKEFKLWSDLLSVSAYSLAILIWIWFFRVPIEKEPSPQPRLVPHCVSLVAQYWNRASKMRKAKVLSLLHLTSHPERS